MKKRTNTIIEFLGLIIGCLLGDLFELRICFEEERFEMFFSFENEAEKGRGVFDTFTWGLEIT